MKRLLCLVGLSLAGTAGTALATPRPVVLELFTSNSCSSCPPAYELLERVTKSTPDDVQLIRMDLHVDYWNQLNWVDQYSDPAFTERQRKYARDVFGANRVYTPQLVVNGRREMVGNNARRVPAAITQSDTPAVQPLALELSRDGQSVVAAITLDKRDVPTAARLWLAITEDRVVSHVGAGENAGRTLREDGVVRYLQPVENLDADNGSYQHSLALPAGTSSHPLHIVAFVQQTGDHRITAAASQPVTPR